MGIFIGEKDVIKFDVFYKQDGELLVASTVKSEVGDDAESFSITFDRPNFRSSSEIMSKVVKMKGENVEIDPMALRYQRLVTLIRAWSVKDDDGNLMRPSQENIDKLQPAVAEAISLKLEQYI